MSELTQEFVAIVTGFSYWRGQRQLSEDDVVVRAEGFEIDADKRTTPSIRGLAEKYPLDTDGVPWLSKFRELDKELIALRSRLTVEFRQPLRLTRKSLLPEIITKVLGPVSDGRPTYSYNAEQQSIAYRLHALADRFCEDWSEIRRQIVAEVPSKIQERLPPDTVRGRAKLRESFNVKCMALSISEQADNELWDADYWSEHLETIREMARARIEAVVSAVVEGPTQELLTVISSLEEQLDQRDDSRSTVSVVRVIGDKLEKLQAFSLVSNDALRQKIATLSDAVAATSDGVAGSRTRVDASLVRQAARALAEELQSDQMAEQQRQIAQQNLGRLGRRLARV